MATQFTHRSTQGEMLDEIAWRQYGGESGYVERLLASPFNYRLSDLPEILPISTIVVLPAINLPPTAIARLWD